MFSPTEANKTVFFFISSKNPEEAELEDTLNQVVRNFDTRVCTHVNMSTCSAENLSINNKYSN